MPTQENLGRAATAQDIKQADRKLAHQYHPDISKAPKRKEKFLEIGEAFAVFKDPEKQLPDDHLGQPPVGEPFTAPPRWQQE